MSKTNILIAGTFFALTAGGTMVSLPAAADYVHDGVVYSSYRAFLRANPNHNPEIASMSQTGVAGLTSGNRSISNSGTANVSSSGGVVDIKQGTSGHTTINGITVVYGPNATTGVVGIDGSINCGVCVDTSNGNSTVTINNTP